MKSGRWVIMAIAILLASVAFGACEAKVTKQESRQAARLMRDELRPFVWPPGTSLMESVERALKRAPNNPDLQFARAVLLAKEKWGENQQSRELDTAFKNLMAVPIPVTREDWLKLDRAEIASRAARARQFLQYLAGLRPEDAAENTAAVKKLEMQAARIGSSTMMRRLVQSLATQRQAVQKGVRDFAVPLLRFAGLREAEFYQLLDRHYDAIQFDGDWEKASNDPEVQAKIDVVIAQYAKPQPVMKDALSNNFDRDKDWHAAFSRAVSRAD